MRVALVLLLKRDITLSRPWFVLAVIFVGELEGAVGFEKRNVFAKWKIVPSNNRWRVLEGDSGGRTWISEATEFGALSFSPSDQVAVAVVASVSFFLRFVSCRYAMQASSTRGMILSMLHLPALL